MLLLLFSGAPVERTLVADQGTYTITGQAATFQRVMPAGQGTFAITGQAATLKTIRQLTAAPGSYAIAGQAAGLIEARRLVAAQGSYAIAGQAATLREVHQLVAAQGTYSLVGQAATFHRFMPAAQGSFALAGQAAVLRQIHQLVAGQGNYILAGQAALLARAKTLVAAQGAYTLAGQAAVLLEARRLNAQQGAFTLAGQAAGLRQTYNALVAGQGAYTLAGQAAILREIHQLVAAQGSYTLAGQAAGLRQFRKLVAGQGTYTLSGQAATLTEIVPAVGASMLWDDINRSIHFGITGTGKTAISRNVSGNRFIKGTEGKTSAHGGKWGVTFTVTARSGGDAMLGLADDSFNGTTSWLGQGTTGAGVADTGIWFNNALVSGSAGVGYATGDKILAVFDATTRMCWFRNVTTAGSFVGSPTAGTGGVTLTGSGAIKPCFQGDAVAATIEIDSTCAGVTLPSGFSAMVATGIPTRPIYVTKAGNDTTGTGAIGAPYLTITKGYSVAVAGQTVYIGDGVYAEVLSLGRLGTHGAPITLKSQNKWGAKIKPSGYTGYAIIDADTNYNAMDGLEIDGSSSRDSRVGIWMTGQNISAFDCYVHDINLNGSDDGNGGAGIIAAGGAQSKSQQKVKYCFVKTCGNLVAQGGTINTTRVHNIYLSSVDSEIVGNISVDGRATSGGNGLVSWHDNARCLIAHNTMFANDGSGISLGSGDNYFAISMQDHMVINNLCYANGEAGIKTSNDVSAPIGASTFTNNICNGNSPNVNVSAGGSTATGTITTAPSFVNYQADGSGDYHPTTGSNADGTGTTLAVNNTSACVTLPWRDFYGNARSGTPDIGAASNPSSGAIFTLVAGQGTYTLSGQAATLKEAHRLVAAQGAFALAGQTATLKTARQLVAAQGAFALAGQAATLKEARRLIATQGAYTLAGQAAILKEARRIVADLGTFTLAGQAAILGKIVPNRMTADPGTFTLAGQAAVLREVHRLLAAQGAYSLSGQAASLSRAKALLAAQGSFLVSGQAAGKRQLHVLGAGLGNYTLAGQAATLRQLHRLIAAQGVYTVAGQASTGLRGKAMIAAQGSFAIAGQSAGKLQARRLTAAFGSFALSGLDARLGFPHRILHADRGLFTLVGFAPGLIKGGVGGASEFVTVTGRLHQPLLVGHSSEQDLIGHRHAPRIIV